MTSTAIKSEASTVLYQHSTFHFNLLLDPLYREHEVEVGPPFSQVRNMQRMLITGPAGMLEVPTRKPNNYNSSHMAKSHGLFLTLLGILSKHLPKKLQNRPIFTIDFKCFLEMQSVRSKIGSDICTRIIA